MRASGVWRRATNEANLHGSFTFVAGFWEAGTLGTNQSQSPTIGASREDLRLAARRGQKSLPFPVLPGYRPMNCLEDLLSGGRTANRTRVLYDTQLLGACLHASESGGRSRPEAVRGMPDVPVAPPQPPGPILFGPSFAVASLSLQLLSTCAADMGSKWVR